MTDAIRAKEMVVWTAAGVGFFVFGMGSISVAQKADDNAKVAKPDQPQDKDPILDKLLKAKEEHVKDTDEARKKFLDALDEKIKAAADKGDLNVVERFQTAKDTFEKEGSLPGSFRDRATLTAKGQMDTRVRLANAKLRSAYEEAVKDYTKAKKFELAKAIQDEQKEFSTGVSRTKVTINDRKDGSGLRYLSQGAVYLADRDYLVVTYPRELAGSTMVVRPADRHGDWLQALKVSVSRDCTIYAAIRWEYNGEVRANEAFFNKLAGAGWTPVQGRFEVTQPANEDWKWKVLKKQIKKGGVDVSRDIDAKVHVVFLFK